MKRVRLRRKIRKACQGSSGGFTLIEVMIALALVGIIAIAFLSAISTASMALIATDERATAESLARSQMEYVKNLDYDSTDPYDYEQDNEEALPDHPGYFVSVSAEPLHSPDDGIQKITVIVSRDGKEIIALEDYKRDPL
jgi:prepilin-type N-terminal cleavage/methylation domain-containing protein